MKTTMTTKADKTDYVEGAAIRIKKQASALQRATLENRPWVILNGWIESIERELQNLRILIKDK